MPLQNTPTGQWWQYPLAGPTPRFDRFNTFVRQMDTRFAGLPGAYKFSWELWAKTYPWNARCIPWIFDFDPFDNSDTVAVAAYRATNCARLTQGLGVVDLPPTLTATPGDDFLVLNLPTAFSATFGSYDGPPPGPLYATVRGLALTHISESGPAISKFRYGFTAPITFGVPFSLVPLYTALPGLAGSPAAAAAVSIAGEGNAPFFGERLFWQNPV